MNVYYSILISMLLFTLDINECYGNQIKLINQPILHNNKVIGFQSSEQNVVFVLPDSIKLLNSFNSNPVIISDSNELYQLRVLLKKEFNLAAQWSIYERLINKKIKIFPAKHQLNSFILNVPINGVNHYLPFEESFFSSQENGRYYEAKLSEDLANSIIDRNSYSSVKIYGNAKISVVDGIDKVSEISIPVNILIKKNVLSRN